LDDGALNMALDASFILIESDWPSARALRLVAGLNPRWVVLHRLHDGEDLYYTFWVEDVVSKLSDGADLPVGEVLRLRESDAAPTRAADTDAGGLAVVVSRGLVAGVAVPEPASSGGPPRWKGSAAGGYRGPFRSGFDADAGVDVDDSGLDVDDSGSDGGSKPSPSVLRAVEASAPPQVALGDTVSLLVKLTSDVTKPGTVPLAVAIGDSVSVVVSASGGLEVLGRSDGEIKVTAAGEPALPFKIAGRAIGPGEVRVYIFQPSQGVSHIAVSIRVVDHVSDGNPTTARVRIEPVTARPPDLELDVLEEPTGYTMWLRAADQHLNTSFGPIKLPQDPRAFFGDFYADIESILTSAATPPQKLQRLASKGDYLFAKLVPSAAREQLWKLRPRIRSIHVQSEEPWIPWELIKLSGDDGTGLVVAGGFLCEEFEMTRWVLGLNYYPELTLNNIGVVTPGDSGLTAAEPERDALLDLKSPQRLVTPIEAEEVTLCKVLAGGKLDAIHFTGHGSATAASADRAEIELEHGSRLRPENLTGETANLGRRGNHPIIFLNACEIGRAGMGLNSPGGWPRGFLEAQAGAFVGPFWKVFDASAASFASSFYKALIAGASVGKAAFEARKQIQAASDPTWLAYSVYAHADARVT